VCHFIPPRQSRCLRSLAGLCGRNGRLTGADPNPFSSTFKQVGNAIGTPIKRMISISGKKSRGKLGQSPTGEDWRRSP
ncbi:MAG: hypothetical protein RLQ73_28695, partial [Hoeflea sp. D1-CHI-28]